MELEKYYDETEFTVSGLTTAASAEKIRRERAEQQRDEWKAAAEALTKSCQISDTQRDEALRVIEYRVERVKNGEITANSAIDSLSRDPARIRAMGEKE